MEDILFDKLIEKIEKVNKKVNKEFIKKAFYSVKTLMRGSSGFRESLITLILMRLQ